MPNISLKTLLARSSVEEGVSMECVPKTFAGLPLYGLILVVIGAVILLTVLILELVLLPKRRKLNKEIKKNLLTHAVATGGSSGIGLAVAKELVKNDCKYITLIARNETKLNKAKEELDAYVTMNDKKSIIQVYSVDVGVVDKVTKAAEDICTSNDVPCPTMLFNVAGTSSSAAFVSTDFQEFERLMNINYLGTAYVTRAFLPYMMKKEGKDENHPRSIMFTSSQAGQLGVFGYTAYSASKYALKGLAEALQMEVGRDNISIQLSFPPDTDTPGFEEENKDKPEETRLISETSGLFSAEQVASKMVNSSLQKRPPFNVYFGLEGWMLANLTAGMSPVHSILDASVQIFFKGLLRFISLFYLFDFRNIVHKVGKKRRAETSE